MFIRKPTAIIGKEKTAREWMSLKLLPRYIIQYGVAASPPRFRKSTPSHQTTSYRCTASAIEIIDSICPICIRVVTPPFVRFDYR